MGLVNGVAGVIFDYGGVLVAHQSKEDVESLASIAGIPVDLFNQLYWAQRAAYDRGDIEGRGILASPRQRGGKEARRRNDSLADRPRQRGVDEVLWGDVRLRRRTPSGG